MKRLLSLLLLLTPLVGETLLPRKVIAIFDKRLFDDLYYTRLHQLAEMPLNHLGLLLNYWDVYEELPDVIGDPEVCGAVLWFSEATDLPEEVVRKLLNWLVQLMQAGKRVVILGHSPFDSSQFVFEKEGLNRFWRELGLYDVGRSVANTFSSKLIVKDPLMVNFERPFSTPLHDYKRLAPIRDDAQIALAVQQGEDASTLSCLIVTSPKGDL